MNKSNTSYKVAQNAIVAALYVLLTFLQNTIFLNTASGAIQFRIAEILVLLSLFTYKIIPGLTIGCALANISSIAILGPYDMIFGTLASFLAAVTVYLFRNIKIKNIPLLSAIMPALFNGLIIGWEIEFFFIEGPFNIFSFLISGGLVAIGELVVCLFLGIPFIKLLEKYKFDKLYF